MKISQKIVFIGLLIIVNIIIGLLIFDRSNYKSVVEADSDHSKTTSVTLKEEKEDKIKDEKENQPEEKIETIEEVAQEPTEPVIEQPAIVYDGLTLEQLSAKLDRSLNSDLAGKGNLFASYSLELGVDPYLATAIALHETGCTWGCSRIVKYCNNVGGQVGNGCDGYQYFNTLDEGIKAFIDNLYYNYYAYGLTNAQTMNSKYAADPNWSVKVNSYVETIKAS